MLFRTWVPPFLRNVLPHYEGGEDVHHRNKVLIRFYQNVYMKQYDIFDLYFN